MRKKVTLQLYQVWLIVGLVVLAGCGCCGLLAFVPVGQFARLIYILQESGVMGKFW